MRIRCGEGGCPEGNRCADRGADRQADRGGGPGGAPGGGAGDGPGEDRCAVCGRAGAADDARWSLLSRHASSQGVVEYCACRCGGVVVLVDGGFAKILPGRAPGRTGERNR
ncbi:hypothetical protein ACIBJC_05235 [Streptomyces sp. NPDC050509]|uniref:hypothetical protein n=1 Tax=Streptomyces sp. NPDC050509 TaxID=3365620 RepID=UPI00378DEFBD